MKKYDFADTPFIYNVFRNGNIWLKGFNSLSTAVSYCRRYVDKHDTLIELYCVFGGQGKLLKSWN